jgi:serine/threonine protein kinase
MENYKVVKALGQGTWGVVHMAEQKGTGRVVAIKKIKSERSEEGVNFTAVREIKLLRGFKHENVIELVDCFSTPDQAVCLVYECAYTDLEKILANKKISISLADIKRHMLSLLSAVSACHTQWILHRDLKPDNMLFLKDGTMKLADFGLARMYGTPKARLSPQAITLWYKPPVSTRPPPTCGVSGAFLPNFCCVDLFYRGRTAISRSSTPSLQCLEHLTKPIGRTTKRCPCAPEGCNGTQRLRFPLTKSSRQHPRMLSRCCDRSSYWIQICGWMPRSL